MATLDRVASVAQYKPSVTYPNNGFGQALQAVAGAMAKGIGTKVFFVQTGGFDTHASQDTTTDNGAYVKLMVTLNDGLTAFYNDLKNTGPAQRHAGPVVLGVRPPDHRERQQGHRPRRGQRDAGDGRRRPRRVSTARPPRSTRIPPNPTLENSGADVHFETDFRSVYAKVIDNWLGGDSVGVLGGNFRKPGLDFV